MPHELKDAAVAYLTNNLPVMWIDETVCATSPMSAFDEPSIIFQDVSSGQFPASQVDQLATNGSDVELLLHLTLMYWFHVHIN